MYRSRTAAFLFVFLCAALLSSHFVYAQEEDDGDGNLQCPDLPQHYFYIKGGPAQDGQRMNLYGKKCVSTENGDIAVEGHCEGPKFCVADPNGCDGKACKLTPLNQTDIQKLGEPVPLTPPAPPPSGSGSLLNQAFDPVPYSDLKNPFSPSAQSFEDLIKQGGAMPEETEKAPSWLDSVKEFFSPTPLNPNQESFQLQPRDENGNVIPQDVDPQNTITNPNSTFDAPSDGPVQISDGIPQADACGPEGSWLSCMRAQIPGENIEEARVKGLQSNWNFGNMKSCSGGVCSGYQSFDTPEDGARADINNIAKWVERGDDTLNKLMNRLSPPSDGNNTKAMVDYLSKELGISPNTRLDLSNETQVVKLFNEKAFLEHSVRATDVMAPRNIIDAYQQVAISRGIMPDVQTLGPGTGIGSDYAASPSGGEPVPQISDAQIFAQIPDQTVRTSEIQESVENFQQQEQTRLILAAREAGRAEIPTTMWVGEQYPMGTPIDEPTFIHPAEIRAAETDLLTDRLAQADIQTAAYEAAQQDIQNQENAARDARLARADADSSAEAARGQREQSQWENWQSNKESILELARATDVPTEQIPQSTPIAGPEPTPLPETLPATPSESVSREDAPARAPIDWAIYKDGVIAASSQAEPIGEMYPESEPYSVARDIPLPENIVTPEEIQASLRDEAESLRRQQGEAYGEPISPEEAQRMLVSMEGTRDTSEPRVLIALAPEEKAAAERVFGLQLKRANDAVDTARSALELAQNNPGELIIGTPEFQLTVAEQAQADYAAAVAKRDEIKKYYDMAESGNVTPEVKSALRPEGGAASTLRDWAQTVQYYTDVQNFLPKKEDGTPEFPEVRQSLAIKGVAAWAEGTLIDTRTVLSYSGSDATALGPNEAVAKVSEPTPIRDAVAFGNVALNASLPFAGIRFGNFARVGEFGDTAEIAGTARLGERVLAQDSSGFTRVVDSAAPAESNNVVPFVNTKVAPIERLPPLREDVQVAVGESGPPIPLSDTPAGRRAALRDVNAEPPAAPEPTVTPTAPEAAPPNSISGNITGALDQRPPLTATVRGPEPVVRTPAPEAAPVIEPATPPVNFQKNITDYRQAAIEDVRIKAEITQEPLVPPAERSWAQSAETSKPSGSLADEMAEIERRIAAGERVEPRAPRSDIAAETVPETTPRAVIESSPQRITPEAPLRGDIARDTTGRNPLSVIDDEARVVEPRVRTLSQAERDQAAIDAMNAEGPVAAPRTPSPGVSVSSLTEDELALIRRVEVGTVPNPPRAALTPDVANVPVAAETKTWWQSTKEFFGRGEKPTTPTPLTQAERDALTTGDQGRVVEPRTKNGLPDTTRPDPLAQMADDGGRVPAGREVVEEVVPPTASRTSVPTVGNKEMGPWGRAPIEADASASVRGPWSPQTSGVPLIPQRSISEPLFKPWSEWTTTGKWAVGGIGGVTGLATYNNWGGGGGERTPTPNGGGGDKVGGAVVPDKKEKDEVPPPVRKGQACGPNDTYASSGCYPPYSGPGAPPLDPSDLGDDYCVVSINPVIVWPGAAARSSSVPCYNKPTGQNSAWRSFPSLPPSSPASTPQPAPTTSAKPPVTPPTATSTPPKPFATLIADPATILSGKKSKLIWSSVNTSSCELFAPGTISMATGTRGSTSTLALATTTQFTLNCSAPSGATTSTQAVVTVQ